MNTRAFTELIKQNGRLIILIASILLIGIGILAMVYPFNAYVRLVKYLGPALIINSGILLALSYQLPQGSGSRNWMQFKSVLDLAFALILSFNPFLTFIAFPLLAGPLMICSGLVKVIGGIIIKRSGTVSYISSFSGLLFVLFGIWLTGMSYKSSINISSLVGLFAIALGILYLAGSARFIYQKRY